MTFACAHVSYSIGASGTTHPLKLHQYIHQYPDKHDGENVPKKYNAHQYKNVNCIISSISDGNIIFINSKAFKADGYGFQLKTSCQVTALPLFNMRFQKYNFGLLDCLYLLLQHLK
jgi:hypothetical protein